MQMKSLALALLLAVPAAPAFAQVVSTAPADVAPPPLTPEAAAAARKRALAQKVYDLIGTTTLAPTTRALAASISVEVARAVSNKDIKRAKAIMAAVNDGLEDISPQIADATVTLMVQDFTEDQLQALADFYTSPAGQAALKILPRISQVSTISMKLTPQMMTSIRDNYCAKVKCTYQEEDAFTDLAERLAAAQAPKAPKTPTAAAPPPPAPNSPEGKALGK